MVCVWCICLSECGVWNVCGVDVVWSGGGGGGNCSDSGVVVVCGWCMVCGCGVGGVCGVWVVLVVCVVHSGTLSATIN